MATVNILGHEVEVVLDNRSLLRTTLELVRDIQAVAGDGKNLEVDMASAALEVIELSDRADALLRRMLSADDLSAIYDGKPEPLVEPLYAVMALGSAAGSEYDKPLEKYLPDVRETSE